MLMARSRWRPPWLEPYATVLVLQVLSERNAKNVARRRPEMTSTYFLHRRKRRVTNTSNEEADRQEFTHSHVSTQLQIHKRIL